MKANGVNVTNFVFDKKKRANSKILLFCFTLVGYYVYIETSSPARRGYRARLLSRVFPPSGPRCVKWWYNMNGLSIGYFNVYLLSNHGNKKLIWMKTGHQGTGWKQAKVNIHSISKYQVSDKYIIKMIY